MARIRDDVPKIISVELRYLCLRERIQDRKPNHINSVYDTPLGIPVASDNSGDIEASIHDKGGYLGSVVYIIADGVSREIIDEIARLSYTEAPGIGCGEPTVQRYPIYFFF